MFRINLKFKLSLALSLFGLACSCAPAPSQEITIDGRMDDWAAIASHVDPAGDPHEVGRKGPGDTPALVEHPNVDLVAYKVAHDATSLYVYLRSRGKIGATTTSTDPERGGRFYCIVTIDADDDDETGYWLHEGGYYPTSRGYDLNAEIEYYNGQLNTVCYLNHGARDERELKQAYLDQSQGQWKAGRDGPYPAGYLKLLPGTYKQYTQWVYHDDGSLTFVRDKGPVVKGIASAAISADGHELEAAFPFRGFLSDESGRPILELGRKIDLSFSLEASEELSPDKKWASDTGEPIVGYRLDAPHDAVAVSEDYRAEMVFPLHKQHNHAPGIVELPSGELLVSWYRGSGERSADDVAVYGARLAPSEAAWSEPFLMADYPGFPDCNTCLMLDRRDRLWLFWPTILANSWESCLTNYKVSEDYNAAGSPEWKREGLVLLKPEGLQTEGLALLASALEKLAPSLTDRQRQELEEARRKLGEKLYQRLGWQPRCKPTILPSGRILLPLYTDTFSISLMAISDDEGRSWRASKPLIGFGNIQPTVLRKNDGTLVAYMRENGPLDKIRIAESTDDGESWGAVGVCDLPNPGSGVDGVRLASGEWLLIYNDTTQGRSSLAASLSDDEGATWKWTRHLEKQPAGQFHYPAVIQGRDGTIHAVYSYFVDDGKSMKHAAFTVDWIKAGD